MHGHMLIANPEYWIQRHDWHAAGASNIAIGVTLQYTLATYIV